MDLQSFIFDAPLTRRQLADYESVCPKKYKICVYRNHSFELLEHTIGLYLDYADIGAEFIYSDYDDSLSFISLPDYADMLVLWLDISRYKLENVNEFIEQRINVLINMFKKPILYVPLDQNGTVTGTSVVTYSFDRSKQQLGEKFYDLRMEALTGTRMSASAITAAARDLGLNYIPAMLMPALKAVVVDFDNTLYKGVLGEDGIDGIELTEGHKMLQQHLKELSENGFFLCAASKNEEKDVLELLEKRTDFPLEKSDFTKMCISWQNKADSIKEIAAFLNIGTDSILFVDDNPGEIHSVLAQLPNVHTVTAYDQAEKTLEVLRNYPRMKKFNSAAEDELRKNDVIANEKRRNLQQTLSRDEYIKSLGMKLTFRINCKEKASRISELANKTNQFIFNYKRYTLPEIEKMMDYEDHAVVSVELSDKLSDSGIIGVCCAAKNGGVLEIEECFVSCRALGRGIDECIVLGAFDTAKERLGTNGIMIDFQKGERNLPAEKFLIEHFGDTTDVKREFFYELPTGLIEFEIKEN